MAIVVGTVCSLVGVFVGLVIVSELSSGSVGVVMIVGFAALFFGTGWVFIRVIGWVVAGFFPSRKTERD